jgi:sugar/nucleoside kinase (ribokinase family)
VKPVVVAGHICLDLIPAFEGRPSIEPGRLIGVGPISLVPGGSVGNTAPALVALGVPTRLVIDVGSDDFGRVLVSLLADAGVDTAGIARVEGLGTSYSVVLDIPGRDRTFWHHIGSNAAFDGSGVLDRLGGSRDGSDVILHLGYPTHLPALYADGGDALVRLVAGAGSAGATVSIDTAEIDPTSEAGMVDWEALLKRALPAVDVMKSSVDDLVAMLPQRAGANPAAWADTVAGMGAAVAIVTAGADGLFVRTGPPARLATASRILGTATDDWANRELWVPPLTVEVLATTGAGDSAAAGFLAGLSDGRGPAECALLSAAAAAARISGRPIGDAYELADTAVFAKEPEAGWSLGADRVYHGPRDRID